MLLTAGVSSLAPVVALLPGPARVRLSSLRRAPRLLFGFGQKEWAGEEALYWESSVFRYGRSTQRVVLANRCYTLRRQSHS